MSDAQADAAQDAADICLQELIDAYGEGAAVTALQTALARLRDPTKEAAERLIVREFHAFMAKAPLPPGRGADTGKFSADWRYNQKAFVQQHGQYLSDLRQGDPTSPHHKSGDTYARNKKALQRLLERYPDERAVTTGGHQV